MVKIFYSFLVSLLLLTIILACEGRDQSEQNLKNFKEYYAYASMNSDSKWEYMKDTVKWYFKENRDNPVFLYKGKKRTGPWAEWDKAMNPRYSYDTIWYNDEENAIEGYFFEENDFYNLIGKEPTKTHQKFWLDDEGMIKEIMVYWIPEENTHTREFLKPVRTWAQKQDSALIEEIYPDGEIAPSKENAKKWKELLKEYHLAQDSIQNNQSQYAKRQSSL